MTMRPILALLLLAGCDVGTEGLPGSEDTRPYAGVGRDERLNFTGTEPFWGGSVAGGSLTYTTPENPDGETIAVERFAGRGGVSWSGTLPQGAMVLAAAEGECSDGMSDRTYPFTITLQLPGEVRSGCGWTQARPYTGEPQP